MASHDAFIQKFYFERVFRQLADAGAGPTAAGERARSTLKFIEFSCYGAAALAPSLSYRELFMRLLIDDHFPVAFTTIKLMFLLSLPSAPTATTDIEHHNIDREVSRCAAPPAPLAPDAVRDAPPLIVPIMTRAGALVDSH
ncbi:hypothetical protein EVAR_68175_1 [Eumeta japonica]|uniref:Uncharacterized protein n=1 Tax=Eumeta variegata TaxID=151549 RepID=A0A4C2A2H0_EUMVA|nr:hypothetical protein EVAR_68175_1 [Eumeta japonica]